MCIGPHQKHMIDLISSIGFFTLAIITHAVYCRRQNQQFLYAKAFIIIACVYGLVHLALILSIQDSSTRLVLTSMALYLLLIPVFLIIYVSMILMSPSKKLLNALSRQSALTEEQLLEVLDGNALINIRLDELIQSGCVMKQGDRYQLTSSGLTVYRGLSLYEMISGRRGEG